MQPEAKTPNSSGFNTQPPEGSWAVSEALPNAMTVSTHSRPKAAGIPPRANRTLRLFQHTAARRQLEMDEAGADKELLRVSTHSRPKAAGRTKKITAFQKMFQHTAARRRLAAISA